MNYLVLDFETFMDSKAGYSLKKNHMSMAEYILDDRFKTHGFAFRWLGKDKTYWLSGGAAEDWLREQNWDEITLIAANAKFEAAILAWIYGITPAKYVDTMALSMVKWGSSVTSHSLASIAERLGLEKKGEMKTDGLRDLSEADEAQLAEYCIKDVDIAAGIYEKLSPEFPASQWDILDWTIKTFVGRAFEMDTELAANSAATITQEKDTVLSATGYDAGTFRSQEKFTALLESKGYKVPVKKNKKGEEIPALSKADPAFRAMLDSTDPVLSSLCHARLISKQTLEKKRLGKIAKLPRYSFDLVFSGATQTHRFAGAGGFSGNPQQMHVKGNLRKTIKAPKGQIILDGDFTAIEPHILAFMSNDPKMVQAYREGKSLYCQFGTEFFGRQIIKDDSVEYKGSKAAVLGFGYGMGEEKAMATAKTQFGLEWDRETAGKFKRFYRTTYPKVPALWNRCEKILEMMATMRPGEEVPFPGFPVLEVGHQYIRLPSGLKMLYWNLRKETVDAKWGKKRVQWYFDRYWKKTLTPTKIWGGQVVENLCQALAGEVCKEAIKRLIKLGYPPVGQIHDELMLLVDEDKAQEAKEAMYEAMTEEMDWWPDLLLECEIAEGPSWGEVC